MKYAFLTIALCMVYGCTMAQPDIQQVNRWAYQLQNAHVAVIAAQDSFQLMVSDYSHDGTEANKLTPAEVATVKNSGKLFISYLSIGEAEDYRSYWQNAWSSSPPAWLDSVNPNWPGNYKVRYWDTAWQHIVYNYLDTVIKQGFDGAYLDIIDAWYYWQSEVAAGRKVANADSLMIDFVLKIRSHVNTVTGNTRFIIMPQNGEDLIFQTNISPAQQSQYYAAINALGIEDVFFTGPNNEDNPCAPDYYRLHNLQLYQAQGKKIFNIEYLTQPVKLAQFNDSALTYSFVPYACTRPLDQLCSTLPTAVEEVTAHVLQIYPNPVSGNDIIIQSPYLINSSATIGLWDMAGKLVQAEVLQTVPGSLNTRIQIAPATPGGVYYLSIQGNNPAITGKVVVLR